MSSAKPLAHTFTLAQGVGGWGVAPLARSTPTRAQRGTRPRNKILDFNVRHW
ncbi:MAG: hypothetical protein RML94_08075 [Bacteroidia bacterium]|nr:hypothetical protein [Bacteroidia bacterium]